MFFAIVCAWFCVFLLGDKSAKKKPSSFLPPSSGAS